MRPSAVSSMFMLAGLLCCAAPALYGADEPAYLHEIQEEAKRQALTMPATTDAATAPSAGASSDAESMAAGLDSAAFERAMRQLLPGTYALYQQFDAPRKQQVYAAYQKDNRLSAISDQVMQMLSAKPQ